MFLVLHVHYHIYMFCCRNAELGQIKEIVRFILRHPVSHKCFHCHSFQPVNCNIVSRVFTGRHREACLLDTHLLCVTLSGPSHTRTCQRTPCPTCVDLHQCRQRTEVTCTKNLIKIGRTISDICLSADRKHSNIHIQRYAHHNAEISDKCQGYRHVFQVSIRQSIYLFA